jgi:small subunit ribosomal protein S11
MTDKKTTVVTDDDEKKKITPKEEKASKPDEIKSDISSNDESEIEENPLEQKKDEMGLEELPEEILKKLEKKKASNEQKQKKGKKIRKKKKKVAKNIQSGKAFIKATYNNTIVTLTDMQGNVISWASAGIAGFKGPKKSTPYAAQIITRIAVGKAKEECGLSEVEVYVKGVGTGRESAIRSLNNNGLIVTSIKDVTPVPHNGCRKRKPRRV